MHWKHLSKLASPTMTTRPVNNGPVNAKDDTKVRMIQGIGDQSAWRTREKDD
jgi:hypothetical protein